MLSWVLWCATQNLLKDWDTDPSSYQLWCLLRGHKWVPLKKLPSAEGGASPKISLLLGDSLYPTTGQYRGTKSPPLASILDISEGPASETFAGLAEASFVNGSLFKFPFLPVLLPSFPYKSPAHKPPLQSPLPAKLNLLPVYTSCSS